MRKRRGKQSAFLRRVRRFAALSTASRGRKNNTFRKLNIHTVVPSPESSLCAVAAVGEGKKKRQGESWPPSEPPTPLTHASLSLSRDCGDTFGTKHTHTHLKGDLPTSRGMPCRCALPGVFSTLLSVLSQFLSERGFFPTCCTRGYTHCSKKLLRNPLLFPQNSAVPGPPSLGGALPGYRPPVRRALCSGNLILQGVDFHFERCGGQCVAPENHPLSA